MVLEAVKRITGFQPVPEVRRAVRRRSRWFECNRHGLETGDTNAQNNATAARARRIARDIEYAKTNPPGSSTNRLQLPAGHGMCRNSCVACARV
jgi:hypothetical protein